MFPKYQEIAVASGKIVLKKDEGIDILCFDINFDGFSSTQSILTLRKGLHHVLLIFHATV